MSFLKTNVALFKSGGEQVPQEEAERRAAICAQCPLNIPVVGCGVCKRTIDSYRAEILQVAPTKKDSQLKACGVCGCDLKSIVHLPLSTLRKGGDHEFPEWCWQKDQPTNKDS